MDVPATNILSNIKYYISSILIVKFLDFHSIKQGLSLVDSLSHGLD